VAVEPSAAMRGQISPGLRVLDGHAAALPLPDGSADAVWLSNVLQHIPELEPAVHEIRRVLRPGAPVLIRAGMSRRGRPDGYDRIELMRWFPELARTVDTFPSVEETCSAFAAAGFRCEALEEVRETYPATLEQFLAQLDTLRVADSPMRALSDDEFRRGKERIRRAATSEAGETRTSWFDFLVLR
jgi:SAM-dependent methyltransferase